LLEIILNSLDECNNFSKRFSKTLKNGDVISLVGDLGAGKTTFTKFLGKNLGIDEDITSPTFNLVNLYSGKFEFNHMDLYRINSPEELYQIDYENYFYPDGITVIEWAENADYLLPKNLIELEILKISENEYFEKVKRISGNQYYLKGIDFFEYISKETENIKEDVLM